ncbi:hypothetical protein MJH12_09370, partial [bacterium]|nr:hypothetical protein [bacterium]
HKLNIEAQTLVKMVSTSVIPASMEYQALLASSIESVHSVHQICGIDESVVAIQGNSLREVSTSLSIVISKTNDLKAKLGEAKNIENAYEMASYYCKVIQDLMGEIRVDADKLEDLVDKDLWRLPDYTDLIHSH